MSGNRAANRRAYHKSRNDKMKPNVGDKGKETLQQLDENNPIIKQFREYAIELDTKHDRYERVVKLSRDITIESKRIIFLLHNYDTATECKKEQIASEADSRLTQLVQKNFKALALELDGQDPFLYLRAFSSGIQEFIEALTFYQYLKFNEIEPFSKLIRLFNYEPTETNDESMNKAVTLHIPMPEFFLGLADFTGELMRKCINNLGSGNVEDCFAICNYTKNIYTGFMGVGPSKYKELGRKLSVLRQSLLKMEYVCYNLRVRGSEVPKHMLANVITTGTVDVNTDDDEGYF